MTVEGEGEAPLEGEGEPILEGEGEVPAEGEGETPTEGEGESAGCCERGNVDTDLPANLKRCLSDFLLIGISLIILLTSFGFRKS